MEKRLKQFWVLDFDRCLADVDMLVELFVDIAYSRVSFDPSLLDKERINAEQQGISFDQYEAISRFIPASGMKEIEHAFITSPQARSARCSGADKLIAYLSHSPERRAAILTYGSKKWQTLKVQAAFGDDISLPYQIISHPNKAREIASWFNADSGLFYIPELLCDHTIAEEVVLVDDKAIAFQDMPKHTRGYWFQQGTLLPSQQGNVGPEVSIVYGSLERIISIEKS